MAIADGVALYRIFGEADLLLYIGISKDFGRRWKEHAKKQPWWPEMRRLSVDEWFDLRSGAEAAETDAIKAEKPKYNKKHNLPRQAAVRQGASRVSYDTATLGFRFTGGTLIAEGWPPRLLRPTPQQLRQAKPVDREVA